MIYKVNLNKDEVLYSDQIRIILQYLKEQNKQSVVDVARILGYSPGTLVSVADEKYIVGSHTRRQTLIRLLRSFKLDMSVYKNIGKGYKIQLLEYHDNADQPFQYLAIGFSEAKDQLIFYDIKVDFSDNRIVIITDEGEVHSGIIDRNLVSSEMKSTTGGDIQFILNERISLDRRKLMRFATGRVSTGILRIIHLNQTRLQEVLISQYETIKQSEENLEIIKSFLSTPKLLRAFQNAKDRTFSNLRSIVKAYLENRRNLTVELPPELLLPYRQFLSYFPEFVKQTSGVDIQVDIVTRGNKLEIQIDTFANLKMKEVGEYLKEYIGFTRQDLTRLKVSVQSDLSEKDFNLLILDLKHQVTSLKHSLELAQLRNQLLQTDVDYLRQLSSDFANKDTTIHVQNISGGDQQFADKIKKPKTMKIENQNIYGGNQQYADIIINGSDHLSETDRQLIELIYQNTEDEEERKALLASLETVRSKDAKEEDKKKAKSLWKQFRDSMVTESGKQIVKELIEGELKDYYSIHHGG